MLPGTGLRFLKGHGTENDFVVLPDPDGRLDLTPELVRRICDRRAGLGGDGVLRVVPAELVPAAAAYADEASWFMDYRNADGTVSEMCGNGVRVYARYLLDSGLARPGELRLATRGGIKVVTAEATGDITVDMGVAELMADAERKVVVDGHAHVGTAVSMGNPHLVVRVKSLDEAGALTQPPQVEAADFPAGVNVEFVADRGPGALAMRVHERGVGETRSCGTGVCAVAAVVARDEGRCEASYSVDVPGGRLDVTLRADGHLLLRGSAVIVAEGELQADWLRGG